MTWLTGWTKRKKGDIQNPSTNLQKKFTLHTGPGTDSDTDIYNVKGKSDFSDIRFTAYNSTTLLDYWIEEKVDNDYCVVWVKLPSTWATGYEYIYFYYDNPSASSLSDGEATFILFDDCEGENPLIKWNESNSEAGNIEYTTEQAKKGSKSLKITQTSSTDWYVIFADNLSVSEFILEFWSKEGASNNHHYLRMRESDPLVWLFRFRFEYTKDLEWYQGGYHDTGHDYTTAWQFHRITCTSQNNIVKWELDDTEIEDDAHEAEWNLCEIFDLHVGEKSYPNDFTYYDNIIIRKYADPLPIATWGTEETEETIEKTLELLYHATLESPFSLKYHSLIRADLAFQYHSFINNTLQMKYHALILSLKELTIKYHAKITKSLFFLYDALQYIDFLLNVSYEDSIDAECSTASVTIPNDCTSIVHYDVANADWVLLKKVAGQWERQFCGICSMMRFRSPPPELIFQLYDYTYFLTISYITAVHTLKEAAILFRGYGVQTQIFNLDADSTNWAHSTTAVLEDSSDCKEGTGSLQITVSEEEAWATRMVQEDWSLYERITFWLKGTSESFSLRISDGSNYCVFYLKCREQGEWTEFYCDFKNPDIKTPQMNWNSIYYIQFEGLKEGTWNIDDIRCETGITDENGNFGNGILYNMQVNPSEIQYTGVLLTVDWANTRRLDAAREVRDSVSNLKAEPWEFYIDKWKKANFKPKAETECKKEISGEIITSDLFIHWR